MTGRNLIPPDMDQLPDLSKIAFSNENQNKEVVATRGVKLKSKESLKREEEEKQRLEYEAKFLKKTDSYLNNKANKNRMVAEKCQSFIVLADDRTLPSNKTILVQDVEMSIRKDFIQFGIDLNNDETEEPGMGSIALITVLSKIILNQRDRLNVLEYELGQLKNKLSRAPTNAT